MSVIRARSRRQHRSRGASGGAVTLPWAQQTRALIEKAYGERATYDREALPLTDMQAAVLAALTEEVSRPRDIAARAGVTLSQAGNALRRLSAKGLACWTGGKWRLADAPEASEAR